MTRMLWILVVIEQTNLLLTSRIEFVYFSLSNSIFSIKVYFLLLEILICKVRYGPNNLRSETVTLMLVTDVGDQMCWWQVWDVDDRFRMLVNDLIHWENHQHNEKVADIMILTPTSQISHHHRVTNITMSSTSLSPSGTLYVPHLCHTWFRAQLRSQWNNSFQITVRHFTDFI